MVLSNATVTVVSTVTTTDTHGDGETASSTRTLAWALIAPRASDERSDPHEPGVISAATLYAPFSTAIDSDDTIVVCNHSPSMDGTWLVQGIPGAWSMNGWKPGLEVALKRAN